MVENTTFSVRNTTPLHAAQYIMTALRRLYCTGLKGYWSVPMQSLLCHAFCKQLKVTKSLLYGKGVTNKSDNNCHCLSEPGSTCRYRIAWDLSLDVSLLLHADKRDKITHVASVCQAKRILLKTFLKASSRTATCKIVLRNFNLYACPLLHGECFSHRVAHIIMDFQTLVYIPLSCFLQSKLFLAERTLVGTKYDLPQCFSKD